MSPLITLNTPLIRFGFDVDEFVKKIDVNIRIKRVIISFCGGEGNIFRIFRVLKSDKYEFNKTFRKKK